MSLFYPNQDPSPIIGSRDGTTLTGVTLENTYQAEATTKATKSVAVGGHVKASIDVFYTMGASETANTIELKIETSSDNTNWVRLSNDTTTGGTSVLSARELQFTGTNAALATINVFLDIAYKYLRVSIKETGVAANKGTVYAEVTLSGR